MSEMSDGGGKPSPFIWQAVVSLSAAVALGLSGFLLFQSWTGEGLPPGCGEGSGCADVLSSKYAKVFGLPVSAPAIATYAAMLVAWFVAQRGSAVARRAAWAALLMLSVCILGSVVWFILVQVLIVEAYCVYCMTDHAFGVIAAIVVLWRWCVDAEERNWASSGIIGVAGMVLVLGMAGVQYASKPVVYQVAGVDASGDEQVGGRLSLLEGQLVLDLADEPYLGPADAKHVVVLAFDYACPHCRHSHELVRSVMANRSDVGVVVLPMSINPQCNDMFQDVNERFAESCELARIALSVFHADRSEFGAFDQWMFANSEPRTAAEARAEAERRIGADALAAAADQAEQTLKRNVEAFKASGADRVPVTIVPGHAPLSGRIEERSVVESLLGDAAE